jgi:hypothetical protein
VAAQLEFQMDCRAPRGGTRNDKSWVLQQNRMRKIWTVRGARSDVSVLVQHHPGHFRNPILEPLRHGFFFHQDLFADHANGALS